MKPHKHAELIKAWADGAEIQSLSQMGAGWQAMPDKGEWLDNYEYRIKPENIIVEDHVYYSESINTWNNATFKKPNIRFTFDSETKTLKSVELI
jgi:hypothetical protein